ncbi:MAG TPA: P22 phage major capsid protein family protein, partial [Candidatus Paceibacterota bacterium]
MANTLLSPTIITREALRVLHQEAVFIGSINRQYDSQFANAGASPSGKIGPSLTIRMPNQFSVATGAALQLQDVSEDSQVLTVSTQKHVDFSFGVQELTLTLDDFSKRYIQPAIKVLAANIEADAITMYKDIGNFIDNDAGALSFLNYLQGAQKLNESLCPEDGRRKVLMHETHNVKLTDALKGLFNPQSNLASQYRNGVVANNTAGFNEWMHSTLFPTHTTGTAAKTTGYSVNGATQSGSSIAITGGSTSFLKGDVVTFAGCNAVHPETKANLGYLKQFAVTADSGTSASSLSISPTMVTPTDSVAKANVSGYPTGSGAVVKVGAGASETLIQSLLYHPDAFTFVTADLVDVSKFGAWGAREVMDGISMRIARQYDITND